MTVIANSPKPITEVAEKINFDRRTIVNWVKRGVIRADWDEKSKRYLVDEEEVIRCAESKQKKIPNPLLHHSP